MNIPKLAIAIALLMGAMLMLPSQGQAQNAELLMVEAKTNLQNGNYRAALKKLRKADPDVKRRDRAKLYYYYGQAYYNMATEQSTGIESGQQQNEELLSKAKEQFKNGIEADDRYGKNFAGIGKVEAVRGNYEAAKQQLEKAVEKNSQDVQLLREVAEGYMTLYSQKELPQPKKKNAIDRATNLLTKAESIEGKNAAIKLSLGDLYRKQGVFELAKEYYNEAIKLTGETGIRAKANYKLGSLFFSEGQTAEDTARQTEMYTKSQEHLLEAQDLNPDLAQTYLELADLYFLNGFYQDAKSQLEQYKEKLAKSGGDQTYANAKYAINLYVIQEYADALKTLNKIQQDTSSNFLTRVRAHCLIETNKMQEGLSTLQQYEQNLGADRSMKGKDYQYMARAHDSLGNDQKAIEFYRQALEEDEQQYADAYKAIYSIYKGQGKWDPALQALSNYVRINEGQPGVLSDMFTLGYYLYNRSDQYKKADSIFQQLTGQLRESSTAMLDAYYYRSQALLSYENEKDTAGNVVDTSRRGAAVPAFKAYLDEVEAQGKLEQQKRRVKSAYGYLAVHYYREGMDYKAKKALESLKQIDPDNRYVKQIYSAVKDAKPPKNKEGQDKRKSDEQDTGDAKRKSGAAESGTEQG
jgi:tetratricopeptide (TPR) repeat protein